MTIRLSRMPSTLLQLLYTDGPTVDSLLIIRLIAVEPGAEMVAGQTWPELILATADMSIRRTTTVFKAV